MITFTVFGLIFLALGIALYVMSDKIREEVVPYSEMMECKNVAIGKPCDIIFEIKEPIQAPIYVYYQLDNFYQNHRRYVKSRSFDQLKGTKYYEPTELTDCDPITKNSDIYGNVTSYFNKGKVLNASGPAMPCGLVAKSFFNDTYKMKILGDTNFLNISERGIAWESDKDYKFKILEGNNAQGVPYKDLYWMDVTNGKIPFLIRFRAFYCLDENCRSS